MNRVTITLTPHGEIARICSDEPIECYWVSPHTPHDRVYLFDAVYTGPQFVREEIGGYAVGHANDGTLGGSGAPISPKLPPSRPALRAISDHDDPRPDGEPLRAGTNDAPIVPREPTKAMTDAAIHDYIGRKPMTPSAHYAAMWRAMHDAATGIDSEYDKEAGQ